MENKVWRAGIRFCPTSDGASVRDWINASARAERRGVE